MFFCFVFVVLVVWLRCSEFCGVVVGDYGVSGDLVGFGVF